MEQLYTKNVVCPYCKHTYDNWENVKPGYELEVCDSCGKMYEKYTEVEITYSTKEYTLENFIKSVNSEFDSLLFMYDQLLYGFDQDFKRNYKNRQLEYLIEKIEVIEDYVYLPNDLKLDVEDIEGYEEKSIFGTIDKKVKIKDSGLDKLKKIYNKEVLRLD